ESLRCAEPDVALLRDLYTELEFHSLLSELDVPAEQKTTETKELASAEDFAAWLRANEARPLTFAVESSELFGVNKIGFCALAAEAAVLPGGLLEAARAVLEDEQ